MSNQRSTSRDDDLLLQGYSRNVTKKSWALFSGNAVVVSAIPICKEPKEPIGNYSSTKDFSSLFQGFSGEFIKWIFHSISFILSSGPQLVRTLSTWLIKTWNSSSDISQWKIFRSTNSFEFLGFFSSFQDRSKTWRCRQSRNFRFVQQR